MTSSSSLTTQPNSSIIPIVSDQIASRTQQFDDLQKEVVHEIHEFMTLSCRGGRDPIQKGDGNLNTSDDATSQRDTLDQHFSEQTFMKHLQKLSESSDEVTSSPDLMEIDKPNPSIPIKAWRRLGEPFLQSHANNDTSAAISSRRIEHSRRLEFREMAKQKLHQFLNIQWEGGDEEITIDASHENRDHSWSSLLPSVEEEEFEEYCGLEMEDDQTNEQRTPLQECSPADVFLPSSTQFDSPSFGIEALPPAETPSKQVNGGPHMESVQETPVSNDEPSLLQLAGIDLDALMSDFSPPANDPPPQGDQLHDHLEQLKKISEEGEEMAERSEKPSKKKQQFMINLLSSPALSKKAARQNSKKKKNRSFKFKKHLSNNMLSAEKKEEPNTAHITDEAKPEDFMKSIMEEKSFDICFLFGKQSISAISHHINTNKRMHVHWGDTLEENGGAFWNHNFGQADDLLQNSRGQIEEARKHSQLLLQHLPEGSRSTQSGEHPSSPPDHEHSSVEYYETSDDLPLSYQDASPASHPIHEQPKKKRRLEMIRSLLDRVKSSHHKVALPQTKPIIDQYLHDRVNGQSSVSIRFSSILQHLREHLSHHPVYHHSSTQHSDVLLRRVVVALLFSVHEYNLSSENTGKQFEMEVKGSDLENIVDGRAAIHGSEEILTLHFG